jgi:hypothetical protein
MMTIPSANAVLDIDTYCFLSAAPNPVGLGQQVMVIGWINWVSPTASGGQGDRYKDITVSVAKPDGTTETKGPFTADPISNIGFFLTPDQIGTYTLVMNFPGQRITGRDRYGVLVDNYYKPDQSAPVALVVQQAKIEPYPEYAIPTGYWERPINSEMRNWGAISGNWLMAGSNNANAQGKFNPYTTAPRSSHVLWTKTIADGGLIGGELGDKDYYTGVQYEHKFNPPVIINGKLFYNTPDPPRYGYYCVDLRTGEELWFKNSTSAQLVTSGFYNYLNPGINMGQIVEIDTPNQHGAIPYLWRTQGNQLGQSFPSWSMYDAFTGNWIMDIRNPPSGTTVFGSSGEILVYQLNVAAKWIAMWNSTKCIPPPDNASTGAWQWRPPVGSTLNGNNGWQLNQTLNLINGTSIRKIGDGKILLQATDATAFPNVVTSYAIDMSGNLLWGPKNHTITSLTSGPLSDGIWVEYEKETLTWSGFSMATGDKIWGPNAPLTNAWAMYMSGTGNLNVAGNGKFYCTTYDGAIHCYDIFTGVKLWSAESDNPGLETPYGTYPHWGGVILAGGVVMSGNGEHSPDTPLYRGEKLYGVDAVTGERLWGLLGWYEYGAVADGYLAIYNYGEGRIYCIGKGLSATTVTAPLPVQPQGTPILIQGTVTDQSPGDTNIGVPMAGTPAIADQYMDDWMAYLLMQHPKPADATGVPVHLTAVGPDGSVVEIGTVTSDANGIYKTMWTPNTAGAYTIHASFDGTQSYWASSAETVVGVNAPPAASPTPTPTAANAVSAEMFYAISAIIIVLILIVAVLLLRKK